ncbi:MULTISPECIES: four-helix bundle copper-binding protein [Xanthocytophaga]|uniref:Four-helix bundle copper-binding protein n=1 Tax=Xanthocytophaga agilis TaxID=3048010 RepID=A0AAE3UG74_9BACT|nr:MULTISPECIES: four-helix bundle copper-binding protein [Xanthocytophaga]MDJ1467707.1 four-helix bundle copper-binding protein [Xanthocytophaga flavus]MDJ1501333.1 four-helix bundle copper-binding protein [Xanthocytophaga agilis]
MAIQNLNTLVESLARCIHGCERCATGCLNEADTPLVRTCIATALDCADACSLTLKLISRESKHWNHLLQLCVHICKDCEKECGKHSLEYCRECAEICHYCAETCEQYMTVVVL